MIESQYWKEELQRIAQGLKKVGRPRRWGERAHCVLERDIMVGFFMLRRLIELHKVSRRTSDQILRVFSYKAVGKKVHRLNGHEIWELYDMERERPEQKRPLYVANQFIHAYTSFVARDESRNWSDVFVVSDFDKNDCIWRVPVDEIRRLFLNAASDYPHIARMVFNEKKGDYDIETN
ncbi:hypothetical protein [Methylohalobius crimeensis]|uniref:hypothetical protein n=1 Tax=Methylohalobius crimeensis TaxID=244365 RepID=UPI0003B362BC|nr:hypothetical protein [Methylohalobius crimeensis]